jgi:carbamoyltransferase
VLVERATEFFDLAEPMAPTSPEHFMLAVAPVRAEARERIPAVTHIDGTARLHLVERAVHPIYYGLIEAFGKRTGVPVLLNTSFNLRGEPIVNTATDAIKTFQWSGMDALVLGHTLLLKEELGV